MSVDGVPAAEASLQPSEDRAAEVDAGPLDKAEQAAEHVAASLGGGVRVPAGTSGPRNAGSLHLGGGTDNKPVSKAHLGPVLVSRRATFPAQVGRSRVGASSVAL